MAKKKGNGDSSDATHTAVMNGAPDGGVGKPSDYQAESITVLKGLEAVRKRPAMYIGSTGPRGLHHLVYEVVDNAIDEALAGVCDRIVITLGKDQSITVQDNGRGIPVGMHKEQNKPAVEVVMTMLHAGGKFDGKSYKVSGGLHGVGVSVVNALSKWLEVEVSRDGFVWHQRYERGVTATPLKKRGSASGTGTKVQFLADDEVFEEIEYHFDTLAARLRELAYLNRGVTIVFGDENTGRKETYFFKGGISQFVEYLNEAKEPLFKPPVYFGKERDGISVEIALQWNDTYVENIFSYANNINTTEGGTHLSGFKTALTRTLNNYATKNNLFKNDKMTLLGEDTREGLTAVISVKLMQPQFEGQTKTKLGNSEVRGIVESLVGEALAEFVEENPSVARKIMDKCLTAARARDAARKAKELTRRKSALDSGNLPGKLADCALSEPDLCEIYIVEGESAGGCFSGDTKVALADGRALSFEELVREQAEGREHFCYTIRNDGRIGLERVAHPRVTKHNAAVVRVTLDNGESITCTPDHRFMLRDGTYREASTLSSGDSLMPLYRRLSDKAEPGITIDGYEMTWDPRSETWLFTHTLADWHNRWTARYEELSGDHCHHIDFDKRNNNPTNITRLPSEEHLALHRRHASRTLHRPDVIDKCRALRRSRRFRVAMSVRMRRADTRRILSDQALAQWADDRYKAFMTAKWREFYAGNEAYREENRERLNRAQREYWADQDHRTEQAGRTRAHFANVPGARAALSSLARAQWNDQALVEWRRMKTREQWTPEFRARRLAALDRTYYRKTIGALQAFRTDEGVDLEGYAAHRSATGDKSLLRFDRFCERYFGGDAACAVDAVTHHNHQVVSVERLDERIDVYDIEVPNTHNFALASGVFVHNSAKQGRDRRFQAILPIKGKILNVEKARLDKMLGNEEIRTLITAIGTGIGAAASEGGEFDVTKARYGKIIIMTDADIDGAHIRTLLLTFFYRHMRPLIEAGKMYIAQPPLYRVKKGKTERYAFSDKEKDRLVREMGGAAAAAEESAQPGLFDAAGGVGAGDRAVRRGGAAGAGAGADGGGRGRGAGDGMRGITIQRYKGLGEMNPEQLWKTTMDPETRTILKVDIEDAAAADHIFSILMGEKVEPRRDFIEKNAASVRNLDV